MIMFDRRYFRYFDWISFVLILVLLGVGLLFVFSSTYRVECPCSLLFKRQLFGAVTGLAIYFFFCTVDIHTLARWSFWGFFASLGLLVYTIISGWIGMGAQRWLSLYFFRFQPSELIKLFFPVFVATLFSELDLPKYQMARTEAHFNDFLFPLGALIVSFVLILKQPDLGTALIVLGSGMLLFWFIGIGRRFFLIISIIGLLCAPLFWKVLKPYQKQRVMVLLGYGDAQKERYQVEQSKIAIGSGGTWGKGLLQGTQNKLGFLPEDHTDFIFSVMCEEIGFAGAFMVILLYLLLFSRILWAIIHVKNFFEQIIAVGLVAHIVLAICINIGMVTGILPVVGIPLPLLSYGSTNLWIVFASLGWLNNIMIRRFYY